MTDSILDSTKKLLGIDPEYEVFDMDIVIHINSAFSTLTQLGVGPEDGFEIRDKTSKWNDFLNEDPRVNSVKSYIYLRTRLLFDPPSTSFALDAFNKNIKEMEWRLNVTEDTRPEFKTN